MYIILPSLDLSTALLDGTNSVSGPGPWSGIGAPQFYNNISNQVKASVQLQMSMHLILFEEVEDPDHLKVPPKKGKSTHIYQRYKSIESGVFCKNVPDGFGRELQLHNSMRENNRCHVMINESNSFFIFL